MGIHMENLPPKTETELAIDRTYMATARTLMAADRTLMSWLRTGILLLGCGFTIYKVLLFLGESMPNHPFASPEPARFGLLLIALGTLSMLFGLSDHYRTVRQFASQSRYSPWSLALIMAIATTFLGFYLLISIVTHTEVF
jgi:putative membrane protein